MRLTASKSARYPVARMCESCNRVVFDDEEGSYIENKASGVKTWMVKRNGVYFYEMWIKKNKNKGSANAETNSKDNGSKSNTLRNNEGPLPSDDEAETV